jgi:hypothetical protein
MFPFSRAPMFADAPQLYCEYAVETPDGKRLTTFEELKPFGLERTYWGNPLGVGVGFEPAKTVDRFGEIAPKEDVDESVRRGLALHPEWDYVFVEQAVIRPTDDGRVGPKGTKPWRVDRGEAP